MGNKKKYNYLESFLLQLRLKRTQMLKLQGRKGEDNKNKQVKKKEI